MSNLAIRVLPETLRSLGFASISGAYTGIGSSLSNPAHIILLQNLTDTVCFFSWDGINDHMVLPSNGYIIVDITSNKTVTGGAFMIGAGTRFYVKQGSIAPTSGAVYVSVFYGANG